MAKSSNIVQLDGSHGEGGGALIRSALSMAVLTQQGVRIEHVRGGSKFIGLDVEDTTLIRTLAELTDADTSGVELGSNAFLFAPKRTIRPLKKDIVSDRTPSGRGSNALVLASTLIPLLARSGGYSEFKLDGETYSNGSMTYDYMTGLIGNVWKRMNLHMHSDLVRAAYSRDAEGLCAFEIEPCIFQGLQWVDRGRPLLLRAVVTTSRQSPNIADRAVSHLQRLAQSCKMKIDCDVEDIESDSPGVHITVWMQYEKGIGGGSQMGARNLRAENVAQSAFEKCFDWMAGEASLDPIVAEHILLPACFAEGSSEFKVSELTSRFMTMVWVIKQFSPIRIVVRGNQGGFGHVSVIR